MKQKNMIIGGAVFVGLLIYVLVTQTGNKGFNTIELPQLASITPEAMTEVTIEKAGEKMVFAKKGDAWQIMQPFEFPMEKGKGSSLERMLSEMRLTSLVTQRPEAEADFGLNSETATQLTVAGGKDARVALWVGKANDAGTHTYVKLPGKPGVYQLLGDLTQQLGQAPKTWRSRKIYDFSTDGVRKITMTQKGRAGRTFAREEEVEAQIVADSAQATTPTALPTKMVWKDSAKGTVVSDSEINRFLNSFSRLTATEILDDAEWAGKPPLAEIAVETADATQSLEVLKVDEQKNYWVRKKNESIVYQISDYHGQNLLKVAEIGK